jgi:hypothetical protein
LHLPDTVRRETGKLAGETVALVTLSNNDGKAVPPSVPKKDSKDGKPQPFAIDRKYWDSVKGNKQVQAWLRKGWLEIAETHSEETCEIDSLESLNLKTALTIVESEDNTRLLTEWGKLDGRSDIKDACTARLAQLQPGKEKLPPLNGGRR